jgi:hypothetical protein
LHKNYNVSRSTRIETSYKVGGSFNSMVLEKNIKVTDDRLQMMATVQMTLWVRQANQGQNQTIKQK